MSEFLFPFRGSCPAVDRRGRGRGRPGPARRRRRDRDRRLEAAFGPVVQQIIDLIHSGLTNLPAILAALQAAGVTLPSWASLVVTILLAVVKLTKLQGRMTKSHRPFVIRHSVIRPSDFPFFPFPGAIMTAKQFWAPDGPRHVRQFDRHRGDCPDGASCAQAGRSGARARSPAARAGACARCARRRLPRRRPNSSSATAARRHSCFRSATAA